MTTPWTGGGSPQHAPHRSHTPVEKKLVTEREAATILSISPRSLWDLRTRGDIPFVRIGRSVRYDTRDLETWIQDSKEQCHG